MGNCCSLCMKYTTHDFYHCDKCNTCHNICLDNYCNECNTCSEICHLTCIKCKSCIFDEENYNHLKICIDCIKKIIKIQEEWKRYKRMKILWKIAEYYMSKKYSPENILKYIYV